jgi:translation initiation factor IF-3
MGVMTLGDALTLARNHGVDLVEIAPNAVPPVCRVVDFGKYRYEQAKKDKDSRKHQHANKVKEIQLSPKIDPHDLMVKTTHTINFLCEDMKVKLALKFRGREMAHTEFGFQVVNKLINDVVAFGHPDFPPKLIGRGINVMLSPLPRAKRARNPSEQPGSMADAEKPGSAPTAKSSPPPAPQKIDPAPPTDGFANNPFEQLGNLTPPA